MQRAMALLFVTLLASACAQPSHPPAELNGLWSAGPAACAAGVGVRFEGDAIQVVYEDETQTLFDHPRYKLESSGESFRVRITYESAARDRRGACCRVLTACSCWRDSRMVGSRPLTHSIIDARTGSARMRIGDDSAVQALTLAPCGAHPWREELRGARIRKPPAIADRRLSNLNVGASDYWADWPFDAWYVSPLQRASSSALSCWLAEE
jgi:hypothetical protein